MEKGKFFLILVILGLTLSASGQTNVEEYLRTAPRPNRVGFIKAKFFESENYVKLTWTKVYDHIKYKYRIYRDVRVLDKRENLNSSNFITELDGNVTEYVDRPVRSGNYFYAITVVDLNNVETAELVKDQSFLSNSIAAIVLPEMVTGLEIRYELGLKKVVLKWRAENAREIAKILVYRDVKPFQKIDKTKLIKELPASALEYEDVLEQPGQYFYLITTVNAFNRENETIIHNQNMNSRPLTVRFFAAQVEGVQGFDYYTELDVNRSHPPIFFRFIEELFREREDFSRFDIYDAASFKEINRNLLTLPTLPREFQIDERIERLTPRQTQSEEERRQREDRENRERASRRIQEQEQQRQAAERIFTAGRRAEEVQRQNQQRQQAAPPAQQEQQRQERRTTPVTPPSQSEIRTIERTTPSVPAQPNAEEIARRQREEKLAKETNHLRFIVQTYYYLNRDYVKAMEELQKLYTATEFPSIRERAVYFYARSLYETGDFNRAARAFLLLKGTAFYDKYKNDIDFMINKAQARN